MTPLSGFSFWSVLSGIELLTFNCGLLAPSGVEGSTDLVNHAAERRERLAGQ